MQRRSHTNIVKVRRDYNSWVATETLEDYALRFAPKSFRKWPEFLVANTALGGISFLALEAIGGAIAIRYGFANSFWAILAVGAIIFLTGLPICYYASKHNIDMDLLTRGAGFGYIGSTITSLIYASFTFIFFALEAAIMAQAIELYFHLPLPVGYVICSLAIIPLVFFGVTLINQLQLWTQPIWLTLMILPYIFLFYKEPDALSNWVNFAGKSASGAEFDPLLFGAAATVSFSLIAQLGEQVDYLRFLPDKQENNRVRWWLAVILAGPGWIILGGAKQLGGAFLASVAIHHGVSFEKAKEPIQMYLAGFDAIFDNPGVVLAVATFFVIISQIKINVTNAYAGSLAWSNFFSRLTHSHPGRVVWLVFNVAIALLLMELGVFETLEAVLGLYSNIAIAWIGALVADLVVNKPLGISPSYIEFKRAYLYNINPVGFGSMTIASGVAIAAFVGVFGPQAQAFSPFIALLLALILSPAIAWITQGKYYIARENTLGMNPLENHSLECCVCQNEYEPEDMAFCPLYDGHICSLCCSLDARCHDRCKHTATPMEKAIGAIAGTCLQEKISPKLGARLIKYASIFGFVAAVFGSVFGLVYYQEFLLLSPNNPEFSETLIPTFVKLYAFLLVCVGIGVWWFVLTEESRHLAEAELDKQNLQLQQEIKERLLMEKALTEEIADRKRAEAALRESEANLKHAKEVADAGNKAKSEFLANMSHELRTPLNGILGYAQILQNSQTISEKEKQSLRIIYDCGCHLLTLINDILDVSKIEARKMELELKCLQFSSFMKGIVEICRIRAEEKKIVLKYQADPQLPRGIKADEKRLRQVLINLLSNAIKFTETGQVTLKVSIVGSAEGDKIAGEDSSKGSEIEKKTLRFEVEDTGVGMSAEQLHQIFLPFEQVGDRSHAEGTGLGLAISQKIVQLMGSQIQVESTPGVGSLFWMDLTFETTTEAGETTEAIAPNKLVGFKGKQGKIMVVDDRAQNREIVVNLLAPLGFELLEASQGEEALAKALQFQPDLAIVDLVMPVMDGFEMMRRIRQIPELKNTIAIASSASVFDKDKQQSLDAGCDDFLPKPVQGAELLEKLQQYLDVEWVYEETPGEHDRIAMSETGGDAPLNGKLHPDRAIAPPPEVLDTLFQLAMKGNLKAILSQAAKLELVDEKWVIFTEQLREFVKNFQEQELLEYIRQYRKEN
ncbi:ATP-binding protein [Phormidium sp. CCY1219]|uniref:ATP-binding protein n=1 Tax=Phormidium sp. CCY1219 TaxID=2886104 RepID=UPI002D1EB2F7|nr:ATP-binding protein [Phormidium sp. CCY1219]MEB3829592.1 response regulator [Phormidium sp. CCY1219]